MDEILRALGPGLREVSGASLSGEIPLSNALVNRLVAEALRRQPGSPVESAEVTVEARGALAVRVRLRTPGLVPPFTVLLWIERQPVPESPRLVLRWEPAGLGLLMKLAAPVLGWFKKERAGITIEGQYLFIDVADAIRRQGAGDLLEHLRSLRVDTREGRLVVAFEVRVS